MILSIIIVNYNVEYFLNQCLKSIQKAKKNINLEIFVVDNNSVDNSVKMLKHEFPNIKLILNKKNIGFSKANNQAIKQATGKYILLLNPDTIVQENTLFETINFLEKNSKTGALGVKMINGKGEFLPESKRSLPSPSSAFYKIFGLSSLFPKSKRFGKYHLTHLNENEIHEIDVISGAFFMTRKKILDEIGMLDEKFFMYGEDIDLSFRIQKSGYKNFYLPTTSIIHYKGESTKKTSINYIIMFYKAMLVFVKKHYSKKQAGPLITLINIAILVRACMSVIKRVLLKTTQPIIDVIIIFIGMYFLKNIWAANYFLDKDYYNNNFLSYAVPIYITFWLIGIYSQSGYRIPIKTYNVVKGIILGTMGMLIIYGLLPEQFRFSRALILFGSIWAIFSLIISRQLLSLSQIDNFKIFSKTRKRIGVIAEQTEFNRIYKIIKDSNPDIQFIRQINNTKKSKNSLGDLGQLKEILTIYKINEVVFSAKDMKANEIIKYMERIHPKIEIKIAPSESTFIIGSNSIHVKGDLYLLDNSNNQNNPIKTLFKKYIDFFN